MQHAGSSECITRSCTLDEESLVREVQEEALKGLLFISNTLALVTYEIVGEGPQEGGGAVPTGQVLLEPLANDCGVDFERILDVAREKALAGWRLRGGLRGRAQVIFRWHFPRLGLGRSGLTRPASEGHKLAATQVANLGTNSWEST